MFASASYQRLAVKAKATGRQKCGKSMRLMRDRLYAYLLCYSGGFLKRAMAGTLEYMAPEVLQKRPASHASDVYALAITVNELATGALYWMYCCCTGCTAVVLDVLYCC
jgi:serine/threonine protein kinase